MLEALEDPALPQQPVHLLVLRIGRGHVLDRDPVDLELGARAAGGEAEQQSTAGDRQQATGTRAD
jgi:hypothetical protein